MRPALLLSLILTLTACGGTPGSTPGGPTQPQPAPFNLTLSSAEVTLTNREQKTLTYQLHWTESFREPLYVHLSVPPVANLSVTRDQATRTITVDARGVAPGRYAVELTAYDEARRWSVTRQTEVTVTQDARLPAITAVPRVDLQPGQSVTVPLDIQAPTNGTPVANVTVESPLPSSIIAELSGSRLTLRAAADAIPQGLVPVTVTASAGAEQTVVRVPVQIGGRTDRLLARYNALRAQAGMPGATLDEQSSMNCWLHGRYSVMNDQLGHDENLSLPYATPEGRDCARHSNVSLESRSLNSHLTGTSHIDGLFSAPFHTLGMIHPDVRFVGLGEFTSVNASGYAKSSAAVRSIQQGATAAQTVTFPGARATTDLARYSGGEWPDPLTPCPGFIPWETGLPLVVQTSVAGDTTATEARLTEGGRDLPICAYGSTQYVNTADTVTQEYARNLLRAHGAVFIIPQAKLEAGRTYDAQVKVNGRVVAWQFRTADQLRPSTLPGSADRLERR